MILIRVWTEISAKRWIVTYTKHMKQKRKVYQDGVLELCSSSGKLQVLLYDDCEKVIDRRFLKKDEIVESGGTLSIETHIVDIGDPDGNKMTSVKSNVTSIIRPESQKEKLCVEWNVLYTTHMTQKAKKYHDGILRVLICSSHLNLITLLNEDGAILSSKYLKSIACLETGKNCEFPNYLVEICERRASASGQGEGIPGNHATEFEGDGNVHSLCKDLHKKGSTNQVCPSKPGKCERLVTPGKDCKIPLCSVPKKETSGWRNSNATASAATSNLPKDHSKKVTNNCNSKIDNVSNSSVATLRDAWQILSVLKKPSPEGSLVISDPFVEQGFTSQSSDRCQLDLQMSSEKTGTSAWHGSKSSNSQKDSISAAHLVLDDDCEVGSSEDDRALSICSSGTVALDTTPTNCIVNNTVAHTGITTKISEALGDPMLPGSSRTNKQDKLISDIGFSRDVIHTLGALNEEHHLPASSSLLKDNLDTKERSILHGMDTCLSSDSTPGQLCAKASQIGETALRVNATSDVTKEPVIPTSVELANVKDFPTFDLGL